MSQHYDLHLKANEYHVSQHASPLLSPLPSASLEGHIAPRKLKWRRRIGWYGIVVFFSGTIAILLAVAFLAFLWRGFNAQSSWDSGKLSSVWRDIVVSGWVTRSITLSALVIRLAIAAQAGLFTAMLAASLLERGSVAMYVAPKISTIRASNTGPQDLITTLMGELSSRSALSFTLCLLMLMSTLLSQFSSTVLVSDLGNSIIVQASNLSEVAFARAYDPSSLSEYRGIDYWTTKPGSYPTFAEFSQPPYLSKNVIDTGRTIRAFLPYSKPQQRQTLNNYIGVTAAVDMRTACMKPSIESPQIQWGSVPRLTGVVRNSLPFRMSETSTKLGYISAAFNCTLAVDWNTTIIEAAAHSERPLVEWTTSLCRVFNYSYESGIYGGAFLMLNSTRSEWSSLLYQGLGPVDSVPNNDDLWTGMRSRNISLDFSATLCFTSSSPDLTLVQTSGNGTRTEPEISWNLEKKNFDTEALRKQLGSFGNQSLSMEERGIMALNPDIDLVKNAYNGSQRAVTYYRVAVESLSANNTAAMCSFCMMDGWIGDIMTHRLLVAVFQDTLVTTLNPAAALQGFYHTLLQMSFYDFLPEAQVTNNARTAFTISVLMPVRWRGFIAVLAVIFVHMLCGLCCCVIFFTQTRLSQLDNTWQAVAQAASGETSELIAASTTLSDKEVRRRLQSSGARKDNNVVLGVLPNNQIGLVRAHPNT